MMKRAALAACVLAGLACGTEDILSNTLSSGTYALSSVTKLDADPCRVFNEIDNQDLIVVAGASNAVTLSFKDKTSGEEDSTKANGTVLLNAVTAAGEATGAHPSEASCTTHFKKTFTGTLSANDAAAMHVTWDENVVSGTCTPATIGWTSSCKSEATFNIAKK